MYQQTAIGCWYIVCANSTSNHCPYFRHYAWRRVNYDTAHCQNSGNLLLSYAPSTPDSTACWRRCCGASRPGFRDIGLDYCSSSVAGLPRSSLDPVQRVQNAAARLIFQLGPREHIIGCRFASEYKLSCASLCTTYTLIKPQPTWLTACGRRPSVRRAKVLGRIWLRANLFLNCAQISASVPSRTPALVPGIHCLLTCVI
jgi:hypothetical protein